MEHDIRELIKEALSQAMEYVEKISDFIDKIAMTSALCDAIADILASRYPEINKKQKKLANEMYKKARELYLSLRGDKKNLEITKRTAGHIVGQMMKIEDPNDIRIVAVVLWQAVEKIAVAMWSGLITLSPEEEQLLRAATDVVLTLYDRLRKR